MQKVKRNKPCGKKKERVIEGTFYVQEDNGNVLIIMKDGVIAEVEPDCIVGKKIKVVNVNA